MLVQRAHPDPGRESQLSHSLWDNFLVRQAAASRRSGRQYSAL